MGSKSSPSASVCSHSPDAVPIDSSVHQVFFKCRPPSLHWTTLSSASLLLPWGVHDMACLAGRPGGILMIWPAIRSRLFATMSCNLCCPVRPITSMLVTWSFHVMPRIYRKLHWWKMSSCWHILAVLFQVSWRHVTSDINLITNIDHQWSSVISSYYKIQNFKQLFIH